jgi:hypothetical protein
MPPSQLWLRTLPVLSLSNGVDESITLFIGIRGQLVGSKSLLGVGYPRIITCMAVTIELTEDQMQALSLPHPNPPQLVNPRTHEAFVLLRVDQYKKLTEEVYDDSPWTREELQSIAWQTAERSGLTDEDDDAPGTR